MKFRKAFVQTLLVLLTTAFLIGGDAVAVDVVAATNNSSPNTSSDTTPQPEPGALISRKRELGVMGTELSIEVLGRDVPQLDRAIDAAIAEIQRVEDVMTDWRASPLTSLNEAAGKGWARVEPEIIEVLTRALAVARLTDGAFDVSYAGAGKLWDFKAKNPLPPANDAVAKALLNVGWERIEVDREQGRVLLPAGMKLGLGGIAKGYGVDRAMTVLLEHGIEHGIVNAGGDMKVLGLNSGKPWEVAIKHPRDRERAIAALRLSNVSIVTSGDYERFFELDGRRYHHIIDPRTGYPATGAIAATVIAPHAELADALATALCVMSPDDGLALIEDMPRTEAIIVGLDGVVRPTSGLAQSVVP